MSIDNGIIVSLNEKIDNIINDLTSKVARDELDVVRNNTLSNNDQITKLISDMDNIKKILSNLSDELKNKVSKSDNVQTLDNKYNYATIDQFNALTQVVQRLSNTLQAQSTVQTVTLEPDTAKKLDTLSDIVNQHSNQIQQISSTNNVLNNKLEHAVNNVAQYKLNESKNDVKLDSNSSALLNAITQSRPLFGTDVINTN